jgi:pilus assembly protein CpaE
MNAMTIKRRQENSSGDSFSIHGPIFLVGIGLDNDTAELVKRFIESIPLVRLRALFQVDRDPNRDPIPQWIGNPPADVCLIDFDMDRQSAVLAAEKIHASAPGTAIFAVSSRAEPELIIEAMRSGCSEYLVKPVDREGLLTALARVGGRKKEKREQRNAQVMTFIGAKGGCGVTTLATQLGALLADSYLRKTLLVDLHPDFGDAALYLGLTKHQYHSYELMENADRLDAEFLQSFLVHHSSGLDLIPAPNGEGAARYVLPDAVTKTFDFLRQSYDFILVDSPAGLNDQNLELTRYSDQVYIVTVAEVSALRNVVRHIDYFTKNQVDPGKIRIVLNRHHKRGLISDAEIEKAIQKKIFWKVPNQYAQVLKTINGGDPVAQLLHSEVMRNLSEWAGAIGRRPDAKNEKTDRKKDSSGMFGFLNR